MADDPYYQILTELARARVEFVLGGGLACVLQGAERVTLDVDIAVLMSPPNFQGFLAVMDRLGLKPRVPVPPQQLLDLAVVKYLVTEKQALVFTFVDLDRPIRQVDLFLTPELGYERLAPESEWLDLDGVSIRVLSKRKLLELKLGIHPARAKDLADIEFLRRHVDS